MDHQKPFQFPMWSRREAAYTTMDGVEGMARQKFLSHFDYSDGVVKDDDADESEDTE